MFPRDSATERESNVSQRKSSTWAISSLLKSQIKYQFVSQCDSDVLSCELDSNLNAATNTHVYEWAFYALL